MKNVLLLTDFTGKSTNAHHYACKLLSGQLCTFHFLSIQKIWEYTMDDLMVATYTSSLDDALLGDNRIMNQEQIRAFKEFYGNEQFTFKGLVDYDNFIHSVNEVVDKYAIDLIVIGTNGKTGVIESVLGSHTLRLARNVNKPILIIPEDYDFKRPEKIQYLLDYDDSFQACGKKLLKEITENFHSKLEFYRLTFGEEFDYSQNEKEQKRIQQLFHDTALKQQTFIDADPSKVLLESFIHESYQLLVLSAKNQTFVERIFSNSHLSKIINITTIPLMILRDCEK